MGINTHTNTSSVYHRAYVHILIYHFEFFLLRKHRYNVSSGMACIYSNTTYTKHLHAPSLFFLLIHAGFNVLDLRTKKNASAWYTNFEFNKTCPMEEKLGI